MKKNNQTPEPENYDVSTFRTIRRAIGYLAISLPLILVGFSYIKFFDTPLQISISHYYYSNLRDIFTGTLSAVGLFLISYKGHINVSFWKNDKLLTNIAGVMALGVAFVPTDPHCSFDKIYTLIPYDLKWLGWLHYGFAGVLFLILALLAINVFTIGQKNETHIPKSVIDENNIYVFCGSAILVFMIIIPFQLFTYSTLVFEALSLFVFGIAWLIKGRALGEILKEEIYRETSSANNGEKVFEE
ncbi:hypothetical protein GON26_20835 [Flavobacterium sp. GA093]|uniref:DUF998 domain-containing protein n=1 Tax=Flavobacterium hydrocarbonoxydans TaxID=2683249 RepID=A0A6I4NQY1_9FLAO|nr:hypothetical protein [Flavobacterium hydrocarbonoxydans]MWB96816.1 hypothetical protein [Flavobacterium hydrocarbonoxydans]